VPIGTWHNPGFFVKTSIKIAITLLLVAGCKPKPPQALKGGSGNSPVVLVVSSGFDLDHPAYKSKVRGYYYLQCAATSPVLKLPPTSNVTTLKPSIMQSMLVESNDCTLSQSKPDIGSFVDPAVDQYRSTWNQKILNKLPLTETEPAAAAQAKAVSNFLKGTRYLGTSLAGVISYQNPNVQFVFLDVAGYGYRNVPCDKQTAATMTALFADQEFAAAYVNKPLDRLNKIVGQLTRQYNIQLVFFGSGPISTAQVEAASKAHGCQVDLDAYFAAYLALEENRHINLVTQGMIEDFLIIRPAGNEASKMEGLKDGEVCQSERSLAVGSKNMAGAPSKFSNTGSCIDAFFPGENLVVPAARGFYTFGTGTNFAAALFVRFLTVHYKAPFNFAQVLTQFSNQNVSAPADAYPANIFTTDKAPITSYE
jgi:hypothetical protein